MSWYRTGDIVSPHVEATEPLAAEIPDCPGRAHKLVAAVLQPLGLDVVLTIEAGGALCSLSRGFPLRSAALPMLPEAEQ